MSACDHFTQNAWRPELCTTCQRAKAEHTDVSNSDAAHPRSSWRRRSEPNPNNAVTGVRISALASKFQGREQRSGSIPDSGGNKQCAETPGLQGHGTLKSSLIHEDPGKPGSIVSSRSRLNGSRSADLLDTSGSATQKTSSSSSSSLSSSQTVIVSSSSSSSVPNNCAITKVSLIDQKKSALSKSLSSGKDSTLSTSSLSSKYTAEVISNKVQTANQKDLKPSLKSGLNKGATEQSGHAEKASNQKGGRQRTVGGSTSASTPARSSANSGRKNSSTLPATSTSTTSSTKSGPTKSVVSVVSKDNVKSRRRQVCIPDTAPEVIGTDGGLDNLVPEEVSGGGNEESNEIYLSLTDEEKQFALLALGNTVWNSDTRNLQVALDKRSCREFEELHVEQLWTGQRFQGLLDSEDSKQARPFGTFPQSAGDKTTGARVSVDQVKFPAAASGEGKENVGAMRSSESRQADKKEAGEKKGGSSEISRHKSPSQSSGDKKSNVGGTGQSVSWLRYGDSCGSADSGVELGGEQHQQQLSYSLGDITDCLYQDPTESLTDSPQHNMKGKNSEDSNHSHPPQAKSRSGSSSVGSRKMSASGDEGQGETDGPDIGDMSLDSVQAIALLNDVLRDYADLNESSTDDFDFSDSKKDSAKGKKSSDFEARMASVAATLDLTKQRSKRQAPRPPLSPPPEPVLPQGVSPKKQSNQPDPVFKMVPMGKSIVTVPPPLDLPKPSAAPAGLEEFTLEGCESPGPRSNGDGKAKKGITSFFKSFLRRGKDSSESFEALNPDVQLSAKSDVKDGSLSRTDSTDDDADSSSVDRKLGPKFSAQSKFLVIPASSSSSPSKRSEDESSNASTTTTATSSNSADVGGSTAGSASATATKSPLNSDWDVSSADNSTTVKSGPNTAVSSPATQRKPSKGLSSPKMMLKRATAKFSPPSVRHNPRHQDSTDSSTNAKPYPAPKPAIPLPAKPSSTTSTTTVTSSSSSSLSSSTTAVASSTTATATAAKEGGIAGGTSGKEGSGVVRRRAKSPKRTAPPVPPSRTSVSGTGKPSVVSGEGRSQDLSRELEQRLSKSSAEHTTATSTGGTLPRPDSRRSMPVPPPSPPAEKKDKIRSSSPSSSPPVSPIRETENSLPSSPSSPTTFDFSSADWSMGPTSAAEDEALRLTDKIELPTVANQGRKGLLGKLAPNRKQKAPQPPSVKRAKSITESSTLPRGDKKSKKINVSDISAPVMVTDMRSTSRMSEKRRNTISLGDDPAFTSLSSAHAPPTSGDKEGFDEFDFPVLSPLGSLENLYEAILPKPSDEEGGRSFHYYDPPTQARPLCPNVPADGYLEPVTPMSIANAAAAAAATSTAATTTAESSSVSTTMSSSSTPPLPSNFAPGLSTSVKPPVKTHPVTGNPASADSSTSHSSSGSSSEAGSAENSGGSLHDSVVITSHTSSGGKGVAATTSGLGLSSGSATISNNSVSSQPVGPDFVEPEMTEQRRLLLASQPIYEEIPNGEDQEVTGGATSIPPLPGGVGRVSEMTKAQMAHAWLQQPHVVAASPPPPRPPPPAATTTSSTTTTVAASSSSSLSTTTTTTTSSSTLSLSSSSSAIPPSPSHSGGGKSVSMTTSNLMTASMTSSMLPPPPPPPDLLPAPPPAASRSVSRETVSSESDTQSNCSTLSRPRPAPRRKPKRPDTGGSDQYVSMNRPNAQVSLGEEGLRDVLSALSSISFQALQDVYGQCEKLLATQSFQVNRGQQLKWSDFDIYGQPLHSSGRCVVYNAKLRATAAPCQLMILHSRPASEMSSTSHPSLLRPATVFADAVPFSFLSSDFVKTSQLLQNSVYHSTQARCFVAVGNFEIVESLNNHLALLRETLTHDPAVYLNVILTAAVQLLSALSHCLDQGFSVTETDYNDVFLLTRADLRGKVVAFLPHQRSSEVPQGEAMCNFLDRLLSDAALCGAGEDEDDDEELGEAHEEDEERLTSPRRVVYKLRSLLEPRRVECLGQVRTAVEYLLWGPALSEISASPGGVVAAGPASTTSESGASTEQELYVWLEKERCQAVARLACSGAGVGAGLSLEEFYTLKFLLKSSAACLAESLRRLAP